MDSKEDEKQRTDCKNEVFWIGPERTFMEIQRAFDRGRLSASLFR